MPYAFQFDVPADTAFYEHVKQTIGPDHPDGQLLHLVAKTSHGLRHIEVWTTAEHHDRFRSQRLDRAIRHALAAIGVTDRSPTPDVEELDLIDLQIDPSLVPSPLERSPITPTLASETQ